MTRYEILKLLRSRRPLVAMLALLLFLVLMLVGFWTYAQKRTGGRADFRYTFENESYFNGLTFSIYAFYFAFVLILPIFAATEGGVQVAGERAQRTVQLLLARPVSHSRIFATKSLISVLYLALGTGLFLAVTLGVGLVLVGWGELRLYPGVLQMVGERQFLSQSVALQRFALAWPAATLSLLVPLSLSLLVSSRVASPVNAVGASVSIYLVLYVVSEVHFFDELRPWLFTSHMAYWRGFFQETLDWGQLARDASKVLAFAVLFWVLAHRSFRAREEL